MTSASSYRRGHSACRNSLPHHFQRANVSKRKATARTNSAKTLSSSYRDSLAYDSCLTFAHLPRDVVQTFRGLLLHSSFQAAGFVRNCCQSVSNLLLVLLCSTSSNSAAYEANGATCYRASHKTSRPTNCSTPM